jgi:oxygen-independent coproporphyrinogen-3 oxidase
MIYNEDSKLPTKIDRLLLQQLEKAGIKRDRETYEQVYFYPPTMAFTPYDPQNDFSEAIWNSFGRETSLYIHIPFCTGHCTYCHYITTAEIQNGSISSYLKALRKELDLLRKRGCFNHRTGEVVHIGGGTPTYLGADEIKTVCGLVRDALPLNSTTEFTWESSPETITGNNVIKLSTLLQEGVNRLSIGIESFEDHILKVCGRRHTKDIAKRSFLDARDKGFQNINIDMIYGLADQTLDDWRRTLDVILELKPDCVTAYHLRMKPGTTMASYQSSRFPPEEVCREMQIATIQTLKANGYIQVLGNQFVKRFDKIYRYEVEKYKDNRDIIGIGVSAYSSINGWAFYNIRSLHEYLHSIDLERLPILLERRLSTNQRAARMVVLGLRCVHSGVSKHMFKDIFGFGIENLYRETIQRLEQLGLLDNTPDFIRLTPLGVLFSDEVCIEFYAEEEKKQLCKTNSSKYGLYLPYSAELQTDTKLHID